ncbi:MAG: hypothetical protein JHC38_04200 [Thiotrichales bacterium]|jgi:sugar diacid utilization regulator|nr:hypothetical protein [Thiotrichales bacterium]
MITPSLGAPNIGLSAFQLQQANAAAEQKMRQADSLRQSYEAAKKQADAAKQQEENKKVAYINAQEKANDLASYATDLQTSQKKTAQSTNLTAANHATDLSALNLETKPNLTPYDITQKIVGRYVNTSA